MLEHECTTYGLLPQNNNPVLDWKATSFEYNIKDIPKEKTFYKTRNELIAKYTIKNKSDENATEEFMLPFFEPADSNQFVYNNSMILVDGNEPELQTRHIYSGIGYEYYFHNEWILDSYYESDNLNPNTNVRVIKVKIDYSLVEKEASFPVLVRTTLSDKNKTVSTGLSTESEDLDLQMHGIVYRVDKKNPSFELYFFGDTPKYVIESNNLIIEEFDMTF